MLITSTALTLLVAACSVSDQDTSTTEGANSTTGHDFEPKYVGGYPTKETAEAMFEEYDYQAAVQFYVWAYPYLNTLGHEKGFARMGGDERSIYTFDKRMQPQHILMTANAEVIYNWTRFMDLSKGPIVVEIPPRVRGHFYDMGVHAYVDVGDVGPDKGKGGTVPSRTSGSGSGGSVIRSR